MRYLQKVMALTLLLTLVLPSCIAPGDIVESNAQTMQDQEAELEVQLVTARVSSEMVQPGRALLNARHNHWVYDSVPPIQGPNEDLNPLDGLLGSLLSCGMFIYEAVGIEQAIVIDHLSGTAQGELDPRGVAGADVDPRLRAFHITMNVEGPTAEEAAMMAEQFSTRCPIYTTLGRAAPITVVNIVNGEEQEAITTEALEQEGEDEAAEMELELAKPSVSGEMVQFGRALLSARKNHWIYDSVPPINGPNEEVNPLDALLGTLPACGLFIYEAVAKDQGIDIHHLSATVEGDLDPRGVAGANVNPRLRALRVHINLSGPTEAETKMLADAFRVRCPIYTTLERSLPIEISHTHVTEDSMQESAGM